MKTTIITALMLISLISSAQTKRIENGQLGNVTIVSEVSRDIAFIKVISLFNARYYLVLNSTDKMVNITLENKKVLTKKRVRVYVQAENVFVKISQKDLKLLSSFNIEGYQTADKVKELMAQN